MHYSKDYDGDIAENVLLSKYTSYKIGGPTDILYRPNSVNGLKSFLRYNIGIPITIIGLGSNILVSDRGISGAVILMHKGLNDIIVKDGIIECSAGVACAKVAKVASRYSLLGAEFLIGIPGTIGGAVFGNAGCFGSEIWEFIIEVRLVSFLGDFVVIKRDQVDPGYRKVNWPEIGIIVSVKMKFAHCDNYNGNKFITVREIIQKRLNSQPLGQKSCGSVFKNPKHDYAGALIEKVGLKGFVIGGAQISFKHANFFINLGSASSDDIYSLIVLARNEVYAATGHKLELEMQILGDIM